MKKNNKATIIAAFGCLGKTTLATKFPNQILDLESTYYEYIYNEDIRDVEKIKGAANRIHNTNFPQNYIDAITNNLHKYKFIFIVLSKEVLCCLEKLGIEYTILYPSKEKACEVILDAKKRGNNNLYIDRLKEILKDDSDYLIFKKKFKPIDLYLVPPKKYIEHYINEKYKNALVIQKIQKKADFYGGFKYHGVNYKVDFYSLTNKEIPKLPWSQVYVIGNYNNMVPIVKYNSSRENLPGGGLKLNENIIQAARREIIEELNMSIEDWSPIGYQRVYDDLGNECYQLRIYGLLKKLGEFKKDTGGTVVGYELVDIANLNSRIGYGEIGDYIVKRVKRFYGKKS